MNTSISTAITSTPLFPIPLLISNSRYKLDMELKLVWGALLCYNRKPKDRLQPYYTMQMDGEKG